MSTTVIHFHFSFTMHYIVIQSSTHTHFVCRQILDPSWAQFLSLALPLLHVLFPIPDLLTSEILVGTDTIGDVRIPASFCGLLCFRPSYGVISTLGTIANSQSLDTIGISCLSQYFLFLYLLISLARIFMSSMTQAEYLFLWACSCTMCTRIVNDIFNCDLQLNYY